MIAKGSDNLKAYVGSTGVDKMYLGDTLVYGTDNPYDEDGYILKGMVLHLDGADFDGSTWVDRIGGIEYTKVGDNITASGTGVYFGGDSGNYLYSTSKPTTPYDSSTIEVVFVSGQTSWGIVYQTDNLNYIMYGVTNARVSYRPGASRTTKATGTISSLYTHSVSHTHNYFNGVSYGTASTASWRNAAEYASVVGAIKRSGVGAEYRLKGTLYQVRIYNRILTDEEILHNASVDIEKYGISV